MHAILLTGIKLCPKVVFIVSLSHETIMPPRSLTLPARAIKKIHTFPHKSFADTLFE